MPQELEHGAGPGAGTDAGAGGGGGGPGHLRLRPRQPLRPRQSLRLRLRPQPRSYPLRRRWSPLAGGRWQCAPLRPRAGACSWAPSAFWGSLRIMGGKDTAVAGAGGRTRSRNGRGSRVWGRWPPAIAAATVTATVAVTTTAAAATVAAVPTVPAARAVCQPRNGHYGWLSGRVDFSQISKSDGRSEFGRCGGTACGPPLGDPSGAVTEHRFAGRRREKAHGQEGR